MNESFFGVYLEQCVPRKKSSSLIVFLQKKRLKKKLFLEGEQLFFLSFFFVSLLEGSTGDTLSETHEVPRAGEDEDGVRLVGEGRLHLEDELDVVDA